MGTSKSSRMYLSMYIMIGMKAAAVRKGWEDKCEVMGQGSLSSLNGRCPSAVTSVRERPRKAAAILISRCPWQGLHVAHVCASPREVKYVHPTPSERSFPSVAA